jgi:ribonuclease VapC
LSVLDASAILAFLQGEPGADVVEQVLESGEAVCGAGNWSEVAQKVHQRDGDWPLTRALLRSYDIVIEPVGIADAEAAAALWSSNSRLSLGDRLCLALADRLQTQAFTADTGWGSGDRVRQICTAGPS